ncbi:MAG: NUDIX hydrolase [Actinomycetota bacterium]|nr:NUDIX hydrolase [Actinomycetota bacterium]
MSAVRAAGGVVWRRSAGRDLEVLLVHRPKYDDWTVPKGKLDPGEDHAEAAVREVEEETGLRCALGPELGSTSYRDRRGRPKSVRYWAMTPVAGEFTATDEVDEIRWLPVDEAKAVLTYERDRPVLDALRRAV